MQTMGIIGFIVFIIMICSVYAAQKWAYRCFKELEKLNAKIDQVVSKHPKEKNS